MKFLLPIAAMAATALARTEIMVPLHAAPGNDKMSPQWQAVVDAAVAHPDMHFYVVVNPNSGPQNTSFDTGNCSPKGVDYIPHGCNKDWSTNVGRLNNVPNIQTLGYVYARYGHEEQRNRTAVEVDIQEWADWNSERDWFGNAANISIHGIWFDETGVQKGNASEFQELTDFARRVFNAKPNRGLFDIVMNPGSNPDQNYEQTLFNMADAVVTRETCWTSTPDAVECNGTYYPYNWTDLRCGNGTPYDPALNSKAVVVVHEFHDPPTANTATLLEQIRGTVRQGLHSAFFTSGSYANTTIEPASLGNVAEFFSLANNETTVPMPNPCPRPQAKGSSLTH
ncbi:hypothetical protein PG987_009465 [Apiospora arundinis]